MIHKLASTEGRGWVRQVLDGRPIVTGDEREAFEWSDRGDAIRVSNELNRRRKVQWVAVAAEPTAGGPRRFDPTNRPVRSLA